MGAFPVGEQSMQSMAFTAAILDNAGYAVIATDTDGVITVFNRMGEHMLGYAADELIGLATPARFHLPSEVAARAVEFSAALGIALSSGFDVFVAKTRLKLPNEHEWTYVRKDGTLLPVLLSVTALRDAAGEVFGFLGMAVDLTERKRAERAVRDSEQRFRDLFERSPDPSWLIQDRLFVDCNLAAVAILGYSTRQELLATHPSALSPAFQPDGRPSFDKADEMMRTALQHGIHRFEWEHRRRDGSCFPVEVTLARLDVQGREILYCIWRDITERKRAESALLAANRRYELLNADLEARVDERTRLLATEVVERSQAEQFARQSAQWLREVIELMPSGIVLWDSARRLVAWNKAFEVMFPEATIFLKEGVPRSAFVEAVEASGSTSFPPDGGESGNWDRIGRYDRLLADGRVITVERLPTSEGGRLVINTDVTLVRRAGEALARSERMASLGGLVAGIAHEINTPVGNALLVASTLGDRLAEVEAGMLGGTLRRSEFSAFMASISESAQLLSRNLHRAADLIQNFKQVAVDQTSDKRREFDLAKVFEEVHMLMAPRFKASLHRLELSCETGLTLDGFPGALVQVLTNLVDNALVHAFDGRVEGVIALGARRLASDRMQITCDDNGCGIPLEQQSRIFDPFFTTRFGQGGSGLGLSIAMNLVHDLMGGEMVVASTPGSGTHFTITLPGAAP